MKPRGNSFNRKNGEKNTDHVIQDIFNELCLSVCYLTNKHLKCKMFIEKKITI